MPQINMLDTLKEMSKQPDGKYSNFLLGVVYINGDGEQIKQNIPLAIEYLKKDSANLSYANYLLGYLYASYPAEKPNYELAITYLKKAAELEAIDSKEVRPVAYAAIGHIYLNNLDNKKEALRYLLLTSKEKMIPNVEFAIALLYYTSEPPIKNDALAEFYLNRAYSNADEELKKIIAGYIESPSQEMTPCGTAGGKLCSDKL